MPVSSETPLTTSIVDRTPNRTAKTRKAMMNSVYAWTEVSGSDCRSFKSSKAGYDLKKFPELKQKYDITLFNI